jgi:hypothetical protein
VACGVAAWQAATPQATVSGRVAAGVRAASHGQLATAGGAVRDGGIGTGVRQ